jgi:hypothetical protein
VASIVLLNGWVSLTGECLLLMAMASFREDSGANAALQRDYAAQQQQVKQYDLARAYGTDVRAQEENLWASSSSDVQEAAYTAIENTAREVPQAKLNGQWGTIYSNELIGSGGQVIGIRDANGNWQSTAPQRLTLGGVQGRVEGNQLIDTNGKVIGTKDANGKWISTLPVKLKLGGVEGMVKNGQLVDSKGKVIGTKDANGKWQSTTTYTATLGGQTGTVKGNQLISSNGRVIGNKVDGKWQPTAGVSNSHKVKLPFGYEFDANIGNAINRGQQRLAQLGNAAFGGAKAIANGGLSLGAGVLNYGQDLVSSTINALTDPLGTGKGFFNGAENMWINARNAWGDLGEYFTQNRYVDPDNNLPLRTATTRGEKAGQFLFGEVGATVASAGLIHGGGALGKMADKALGKLPKPLQLAPVRVAAETAAKPISNVAKQGFKPITHMPLVTGRGDIARPVYNPSALERPKITPPKPPPLATINVDEVIFKLKKLNGVTAWVYGKLQFGAESSKIFPIKEGNSFEHIWLRHGPDIDKALYPNKSIFDLTSRKDLINLLEEAWNKRKRTNVKTEIDMSRNTKRDKIYQIPMGRIIGFSSQGRPLSTIEIRINKYGFIVSAYPLDAL